ncbi:MAG: aminotransferase class I/II-fold pyridoxal phosphate-dependent enzyme [Chlorobi bacterium]|nr:aminotransferase class I/II-fold pyridoxal phosphate-dependent enzyme [Chlorobiota bacterium]
MLYQNNVKSKLPNVGTSIFAVMSKMANEHNAINLSQGFPDFNCSDELISLVNQYMKKGFNQYAPMQGVIELREAISEKIEKQYSLYYNPDTEITITAGATQALYTAISAFVNEGDEVIVVEPAYDSYVPAILINGGKPVFIDMKMPDYQIDWEEMQLAINTQTKMIIINSPHNPTGSILSAQDIEKLNKIVSGTDIIILSDEVYEHIIFDGFEHQSIARYPKLAERSIIVSSFGKTYHTTGWKLGYCIAPENLMHEFRKIHQFVVYAANTPIQYAVAEFLKKEKLYLELGSFYKQKRDFFNNLVKGSRFKLKPAKGTYFQILDYSLISDEKDTVFAEKLTKENGIASVPVSVFNHDLEDHKLLRFCFAKSEETLEKAAEKLIKI